MPHPQSPVPCWLRLIAKIDLAVLVQPEGGNYFPPEADEFSSLNSIFVKINYKLINASCLHLLN
jgi:hypothetical protein